MRITLKIAILLLAIPSVVLAQVSNDSLSYDITKDKVLYTIGYSHLDTQWRWTYKETIDNLLKNTMEENFYLLDKYPNYKFNFTGARRYKMMKEYYPEMYEKVKEFVKIGRWYISGSSMDEAEVNVSSSESLIRQVLYGNEFFKREFGKKSMDYMLPDCFGFVANIPSVLHHTGLIGFSTQKLTWGSAVGIPFNVGVWEGIDGKGIVSALNATAYTGTVQERLDKSEKFNKRLEENLKQHGYSFDYRYYGIGDQGGAPRENDVRNVVNSLQNNNSEIKVALTSSDQMFKDITPEIKENLPRYKGDLLLTEHSAGTLTSQAFMKRMNRKNENLAQSAEQASSLASILTGSEYPQQKINNSWELVLGNQMHDILPGVAIPAAYRLSWNDEFIAGNGFKEALKDALSKISSQLNTAVKGKAVSVYNPVPFDREDIVTAELCFEETPKALKIFNKEGREVPSQILASIGSKIKLIFLADVPSVGLSVFDVQESRRKSDYNSPLSITENSLENEFYRVQIDENGDISSVFAKNLSRELLSKPAGLEFLYENPKRWPAWNMDWEDRKNPPVDKLDENVHVRIKESGPVRVALEITREKRNSTITQIISLATGNAGNRVEVHNEISWQSKSVSLKAAFPLTAENANATYNLGVGAVERSTNDSKKYEVPSKEWFDLSDKSGDFGVSILEDCKFGSDKPDDNTLRLTLLYSPGIHDTRFPHQETQDWGIHNFNYAIYGHKGNWNKSEIVKQARFFNKPLVAMESPKHAGKLGRAISLVHFNSGKIGLMAFKKAEKNDYFILRVNELAGENLKSLKAGFVAEIEDAYEVNGQEEKIGRVDFSGKDLHFELSKFTLRSFAVKLKKTSIKSPQVKLTLPYNEDLVSFDHNRSDANSINNNTIDMFLFKSRSYPAELFPTNIISEGIEFQMGSTADLASNVMACKGQTIKLPEGKYNKAYLLAVGEEDVAGNFQIGEKEKELNIQKWTGFIGQFYDRLLSTAQTEVLQVALPYVKKDNIAWFADHHHIHYPSENAAYEYAYIFKYEIDVPQGAKTIKLPDNDKIKIFAITVAQKKGDDVHFLQPLIDDFTKAKKFNLIHE